MTSLSPHKSFSLLMFLIASLPVFAQSIDSTEARQSDEKLINEFVSSKGTKSIVFDSSNIKQFWVSKSILSSNNNINILLDNNEASSFKSVLLPIKLVNVGIDQDCTIDIVSENNDISCSVMNSNKEVLSSSAPDQDFLQYHVISTSFHMSETNDYSFNIQFSSKTESSLRIKKIILTFSSNKLFLTSPGILKFSVDNITFGKAKAQQLDEKSFTLTGKKNLVQSQNGIILSDKPLLTSAKIKNIGTVPVTIQLGFVAFTKNGQKITKKNGLYRNTKKVVSVVSSSENSNKLLVDSYFEWRKGCSVVTNAKEDLSDFPNFSFIDGTIVEVNKTENGQAEIVFDKQINKVIPEGTLLRVQSPDGVATIYTNTKNLEPGEETTFQSSIKKDDNYFEFSSKAFSRGTYYVKPIIIITSSTENTVQISDYIISF